MRLVWQGKSVLLKPNGKGHIAAGGEIPPGILTEERVAQFIAQGRIEIDEPKADEPVGEEPKADEPKAVQRPAGPKKKKRVRKK